MSEQLRRTKIITTLGPSTDIDDNLEKIIHLGTNVVRLNFSHGSTEEHLNRAKKVREIANKLNKHIAILGDLQGPKIRISSFRNEKIFLNNNDYFSLDTNVSSKNGNQNRVGISYKQILYDVTPGDILLLDDGKIQLKVTSINNTQICTKVIIGGLLSNNKGINKLGGGLSAQTLTKKDKIDIITAARIGVDYIAISFPKTAKDIYLAKKLITKTGHHAKIISKIERAEVVSSDKTIDDIILASDVIMIARGDLGLEIGNQALIAMQKKLINRANMLNKAVITATQMMESMISNILPTRAEVMDVANAVLDGTDAVMLSAETAIGKYPVETVSNIANICVGAEKIYKEKLLSSQINKTINDIETIIAMSAIHIANNFKDIAAIILLTNIEKIALVMSRINSKLPIFALSNNQKTLNTVSLYRGIIPIFLKTKNKKPITVHVIIDLLKNNGFFFSGKYALITQKDIQNTLNINNIIRIIKINE